VLLPQCPYPLFTAIARTHAGAGAATGASGSVRATSPFHERRLLSGSALGAAGAASASAHELPTSPLARVFVAALRKTQASTPLASAMVHTDVSDAWTPTWFHEVVDASLSHFDKTNKRLALENRPNPHLGEEVGELIAQATDLARAVGVHRPRGDLLYSMYLMLRLAEYLPHLPSATKFLELVSAVRGQLHLLFTPIEAFDDATTLEQRMELAALLRRTVHTMRPTLLRELQRLVDLVLAPDARGVYADLTAAGCWGSTELFEALCLLSMYLGTALGETATQELHVALMQRVCCHIIATADGPLAQRYCDAVRWATPHLLIAASQFDASVHRPSVGAWDFHRWHLVKWRPETAPPIHWRVADGIVQIWAYHVHACHSRGVLLPGLVDSMARVSMCVLEAFGQRTREASLMISVAMDKKKTRREREKIFQKN